MALNTRNAGALIARKDLTMAKEIFKIKLLKSTVVGGELIRLKVNDKGEEVPQTIDADKGDTLLLVALEKAEPADAACKKMVTKHRGLR